MTSTTAQAYSLTTAVLSDVAKALGKDWKNLGRQLGLEDALLDYVEAENRQNVREGAYQLLRTWRQRHGQTATVFILLHHLDAIGRSDITEQLLELYSLPDGRNVRYSIQIPSGLTHPQASEVEVKSPTTLRGRFKARMKRHRVLNHVQQTLSEKYKFLQMKGLLWMDEVILTLEEFYVEMSLVTMDKRGQKAQQEIKIEQLFEAQKGQPAPSRILVEGGPGFGKSTLAAKLAYDWAHGKAYVKHFDLVILLPLRHFTGPLMEMLVKGSEVKEKHKEQMQEILTRNGKRVLLILDGYDEVSPETEKHLLPLLNKQTLSHLTLVVTSRVGEFVSNKQDVSSPSSFWGDADIGPTFCHFIDKRVSLEGMNSKRQEAFFHKHVARYPEEAIENLKDKLKSLVDKEFLKCPLFFLMFLVIFKTENKVQNIRRKSDLYKHIFNFVFRRYFKKKGEPIPLDSDLFTYDRSLPVKPYYVQLMIEFGNFSREVLQKDKLSFSREDVTGSNKRDAKILELGLLIKSISVEEISEKIKYEPVHISLLEYAAAYSLWEEYNDGPTVHWEKQALSLRPTDSSSLLFPFLIGLMAKNADKLFLALQTYAVEYWNKFSFLEVSLLEADMTSSLLDSLTPFLPGHWQIKGYHDSTGFSQSPQHEAIVKHGLVSGKIKLIRWPYQCVLQRMCAFPHNTQAEKIRLAISDNVVEPSKLSQKHDGGKTFNCKELCCIFYKISKRYTAKVVWEAFLRYLDYFHFQQISFYFSSTVPMYLYFLCSEAIDRRLEHANIHVISCDVKEDPNLVVKWLRYLIKNDKVEAIELRLYGTSLESSSNLCSDALPLTGMSQEHVNILVGCASNSTVLTRFSLTDTREGNCLTVDLAQLCDKGRKNWESLELSNVNAQCTEQISDDFQIKNLVYCSVEFLDPPSNFFQSCQVSSFSCSSSFLFATSHSRPFLLQPMSELNLHLDRLWIPDHYKNLQILSLNLASISCESHQTSIPELLLGSRQHLWLTGLEIWGVETKCMLAMEFVKGVVRCLKGKRGDVSSLVRRRHQPDLPSSTYPKERKLQLLYFAIGIGEDDIVREDNEIKDIKYDHFLSLATQLKHPLVAHYLPRFNIICHSYFFENVLKCNSKNVTSWSQLFSPEEGFKIKYDFHGTRKYDTIWSQKKNNRSETNRLNRLSISLLKPTC